MNVFSFFLAVQSACSIADGTFFVIKWLLCLSLFVANVQIIMASSKYPLTFFTGNHNPAGILLIYNVVVLILGDVIKKSKALWQQ